LFRRKCGADLAAPRDRAGTGAETSDLDRTWNRAGSVLGIRRAERGRAGQGGSIERGGAWLTTEEGLRDLRRKRDESGGEWGWRAAVEKRDGEGRGERG
jgi:hypothetical protein